MKIINEKGKLFGLINIVDLLVVIMIAVVAVSIGWRLLGPAITTAAAPTTTLTATMRVRGAHPRQFEEMKLNVPAQLISGNSYVDGAKLVDVKSEPYIVQTPNAEGKLVDAVDPTRIDIIFTIEARVPAGAAVTKIGSQEIRVGREHTVKTRYIEQIAIIETMTFANEN